MELLETASRLFSKSFSVIEASDAGVERLGRAIQNDSPEFMTERIGD
jgi:hypothetical protein